MSKSFMLIEFEAQSDEPVKVPPEDFREALRNVFQKHGYRLIEFSFDYEPYGQDGICDECGVEYPKDAPSLVGEFHKEECSLYGEGDLE